MGSKLRARRKPPTLKSQRADPWTLTEIDYALSIAVACDRREMYDRTCRDISKALNRGVVLSDGSNTKHPIDLLLWKVASGYDHFRTYRPGKRRIWRGGLKRTWMERRLLKWAFDPKLDAQTSRYAPPTDAFVAGMLCRPVEEIKKFRQEMLHRRGKGFGL